MAYNRQKRIEFTAEDKQLLRRLLMAHINSLRANRTAALLNYSVDSEIKEEIGQCNELIDKVLSL